MSDCINPYWDSKTSMYHPCGQCPACQASRKREWMLRLKHEHENFLGQAVFVTLTYSNQHLPANGTLVKDHYQNFLKRLRKRFSGVTIRYFCVGEYGAKSMRPHYHLIIYGLRPEDYQFYMPTVWRCKTSGKRYNVSALLDQLWTLGFNTVGSVTNESLSYVAGYVHKKRYTRKNEWYTERGLIPPFSSQSQGIGRTYCDTHAEQIRKDLRLSDEFGYTYPVPRYYRKRLDITASMYDTVIDQCRAKDLVDYQEETKKNPVEMTSEDVSAFILDDSLNPNLDIRDWEYSITLASWYLTTRDYRRWKHQRAVNKSLHIKRRLQESIPCL